MGPFRRIWNHKGKKGEIQTYGFFMYGFGGSGGWEQASWHEGSGQMCLCVGMRMHKHPNTAAHALSNSVGVCPVWTETGHLCSVSTQIGHGCFHPNLPHNTPLCTHVCAQCRVSNGLRWCVALSLSISTSPSHSST